MPQEGSVAPKERVNIVYRPATEGAQKEIELPLKMLVMGDFTGRADERTLENREPVSITKDNFDEVMAQHNLGVTINVGDKLSGQADQDMAVQLRLKTLKDFTPAEIAKQVPELAKLLELREALTALKAPLADAPAFRKKIEELLKDPAQRQKVLRELGLSE